MAINRTQALVLGFFVLAWATLVALFAAAPEVYGRALGLSSAEARLLFLGAITAFLALLGMGVIRRWRWAFWLIFVAFLVAFLFGPLRVVASVLALGGVLSADGPTWSAQPPRHHSLTTAPYTSEPASPSAHSSPDPARSFPSRPDVVFLDSLGAPG